MAHVRNVQGYRIGNVASPLFLIMMLLITPLLFIPVVTAQNSVSLYYFYGKDCAHCSEVTLLIEQLEDAHPEFTVHKCEVDYNSTNSELVNAFIHAYNPPAVDIPAAFVGTTSLIGDELTADTLETELAYCLLKECPDPLSLIESPSEAHAPPLSLLIVKALIEGINPCGFAVLIVLLASLLMATSKRRVLIIGLMFIVSVFVTHFTIGYGLMGIFHRSGVPDIMRAIVIAIVIPAGLVNIRDFWREKSTLAIPAVIKPTLAKLARYASLPSAVLLGFLATIAGFPCTGPIYLALLAAIADAPTKMLVYLLVYNVIYILPLLIILVVVYTRTSPEDVDEWRKGTRKHMKLFGGFAMVIIGTAMLFGVI